MKVLFVGLGSIAAKHINDLSQITTQRGIDLEIDVLRQKVTNLSDDLKPLINRQITEIDNKFYDIAFITNPTILHYKALDMLKNRSKFYFIEKPIFETYNYDYKELGLNNKNAYVAAPMRHTQTYQKLKSIVNETCVFSSRIICSSYLPSWRPTIDYRKNYSAIKDLGGGVTLDLIHEIDYMIGLFGDPEKIFNVRGKYSNLEITSDDLSVYIAQYKDMLCEVHLDYFGRKYQRTCEIYTNKGTYIADFGKNIIINPDDTVIKCDNDKSDLYAEMEYFIDFVTGINNENLNSPELGIKVLKYTLGEYK